MQQQNDILNTEPDKLIPKVDFQAIDAQISQNLDLLKQAGLISEKTINNTLLTFKKKALFFALFCVNAIGTVINICQFYYQLVPEGQRQIIYRNATNSTF